MPSGPEGFVDHPEYTAEFAAARQLLLSHPGRWRIIYHYDGDGIASASCLVRALRRLGYPVQATPLLGVERERMAGLLATTAQPTIVVDTGASWLDLLARHPQPVLVLDHHKYPGSPAPPKLPPHMAFVNPLDWGVDGMSELCASTLAWLFTILVDPVNWDNAAFGISGAIADRQHVGGFRGLNRLLVDEAVTRSLVVRRRGLALFGPNLQEALLRSIDPFVVGVSGRPSGVARFLPEIEMDGSTPLDQLTEAQIARLADAVQDRLHRQGVRPEFVDAARVERLTLPALGVDAQELSNLQNATGRVGEPSVGVALALGDPAAMERARSAEESWRTGILKGLVRLEDEGVNNLTAIQWFESPETTLAGTQAGLAMNYLLDSTRPVFAFSPAPGESGLQKVSARATLWLVAQGLDLAIVCRDAASAAGGEGGGHRVASGATVPKSARDRFLAEADHLVAGQLPIARAGATP